MKNILISVLTIVFAVSLFACGDKGTTNTTTEGISIDQGEQYGSYYQLFIRSFADSDNDGIGDIQGIIKNIDYIADLGFEGIWLMPFCEADSYHGYDVTDYYKVDPDYGTNEDLEELTAVCKQKGIRVIMDFVLNHTSNNHEWFKKALDGDEKYKSYYVWATPADDRVKKSPTYWHSPKSGTYYYGYFSNTMPDLNYFNFDVRDEIVKIAKFWADLGIEGYRLDGALHLCGQNEYKNESTPTSSISILTSIREYINEYFQYTLKKENPYIVTEVYDESGSQASRFFAANYSTLDFWGAKKIREQANSSIGFMYSSAVEEMLNTYRSKSTDLPMINAPFITNHDMDRTGSIFDSKDKMRIAAEMLLTQEGNPFVYYGEELGMAGVKTEGPTIWDETRRLPFVWGDNNQYQTSWIEDTFNQSLDPYSVQKNDSSSLYNTYKTLLNLRKNNIALKYGTFSAVSTSNNTNLAAFTRTYTEGAYTKRVLVIHNFGLASGLGDLSKYLNGDILYYSFGNFGDQMAEKTTLIIDITNIQ